MTRASGFRLTMVGIFACSLVMSASGPAAASLSLGQEQRTVRARVQAHPGGPVEDVEMTIREVPVDPKTVAANEVDLEDDELVLGLVVDGQPIAYPIRYLAMFEVVNDRVGNTPLAPTW